MENIRISLAAARVNADFTQGEVAKELGVGVQTVVDWEKGRHSVRVEMAKQLAGLYRIPLDCIIFPNTSD